MLRPLASDHADRTDILFLIGLAAVRASQQPGRREGQAAALLDESIASFHAILVDSPGLVRVRLELARAFFLKGEDRLARGHFERVLAGSPPPAMAANVRRFLDAIRARRRWSGYMALALAPDSNIESASDASVIYINSLPFRRDAASRPRSEVGVVLQTGGEYQHPLGPRRRLRLGADLVHSEHSGRRFDRSILAVRAGPRLLLSPASEMSILASASHSWSAGSPDSWEYGMRTEMQHRFIRRLAGRLGLAWHYRQHASGRDRDGPHSEVSLGANALVSPTARIDATFGFSWEFPESYRLRNSSRRLRLAALTALPGGLTLGGSGEFRATSYQGSWSPFTRDGSSRRDRTRIWSVSALSRGLAFSGFGPRLTLIREVRTSNAQLYGYRKNRVMLQFVRQF